MWGNNSLYFEKSVYFLFQLSVINLELVYVVQELSNKITFKTEGEFTVINFYITVLPHCQDSSSDCCFTLSSSFTKQDKFWSMRLYTVGSNFRWLENNWGLIGHIPNEDKKCEQLI